MNLCIDQGNSRTKIALVRENGKLVKTFMYKQFSSVDIEHLCTLYPITSAIVSSVGSFDAAVINYLARRCKPFILFDHNTPVPIKNRYLTPHTLGHDRLAAAVGAASLCPNTNLLIIDAGSAVTYDFVNQDGEYMGGNIAPGIKMRLTVLKQMTKRLPLIEVEENQLIPLFGNNTKEAIAAGVVRGVVFEVKGYIKALADRLEKYEVFLTGGSAPYISNNLQQPIHYEKNLVLKGLHVILEYNKNIQNTVK